MKKYKLIKRKEALSIVVASTLALNMLFTSPALVEESFRFQSKEEIVFQDEKRLRRKKYYLEKRKLREYQKQNIFTNSTYLEEQRTCLKKHTL